MEITWDLFVLLVFGAFVIYGTLIGKNKILGILVNLYIALAVVMATGDLFYQFLSNFALISNNFALTEFGAKTILLVVLVGFLTIKSEVAGLDSGNSIGTVMTGIYGFLTAGIFLGAIFNFMSFSERISLESNFANLVYNFWGLFVAAPVILMIASAFTKKK